MRRAPRKYCGAVGGKLAGLWFLSHLAESESESESENKRITRPKRLPRDGIATVPLPFFSEALVRRYSRSRVCFIFVELQRPQRPGLRLGLLKESARDAA